MIKGVLNALIYSNLWIALAAVMMVNMTLHQLQLPLAPAYLLGIIFASTICSYTLHRLVAIRNIPKDLPYYPPIVKWSIQYKIFLQLAFGIAAFSSIICFFILPIAAQICMIIIGIITLGYSIPLFQLKGKKFKFRDLGISKIFLISIIWAISTGLLPALYYNTSLTNWPLISIVIERFLFVFIITLPFDIRDMGFDQSQELKTIPILIGIPNTKKIAIGLMALLSLLSTVRILYYPTNLAELIALLAAYIITIALVQQTKSNQEEYFYLGLLDGTMILMPTFVGLAYYFN